MRTVFVLINPNCTHQSHLRKNSNLNWSRKIIPDQQPSPCSTKTGFDGISKEDQFAAREKAAATHRVQNWEAPTLLQCKFRHKFNEVLSHPANFSSRSDFERECARNSSLCCRSRFDGILRSFVKINSMMGQTCSCGFILLY